MDNGDTATEERMRNAGNHALVNVQVPVRQCAVVPGTKQQCVDDQQPGRRHSKRQDKDTENQLAKLGQHHIGRSGTGSRRRKATDQVKPEERQR